MLTKTRTALITLIAACSIGTAAIAPAISKADKNNHKYEKTVGKKNRPWHNTCANAVISLENWSEMASQQLEKHEMKAAEESIEIAGAIKENAIASGCKGIGIAAPKPTAPKVSEASKEVSVEAEVSKSSAAGTVGQGISVGVSIG